MEVRDIFELRRGSDEDKVRAYDIIRARYKTYHGYHTTLCMFWCASDVMQIRLREAAEAKRTEDYATAKVKIEEAEKIYAALKRMLPTMRDDDIIGDQMLKLDILLDEERVY